MRRLSKLTEKVVGNKATFMDPNPFEAVQTDTEEDEVEGEGGRWRSVRSRKKQK